MQGLQHIAGLLPRGRMQDSSWYLGFNLHHRHRRTTARTGRHVISERKDARKKGSNYRPAKVFRIRLQPAVMITVVHYLLMQYTIREACLKGVKLAGTLRMIVSDYSN
jgi:hypothetical protein